MLSWRVVDIFHAKSHLWDVAKAIYTPGSDLAAQWAKQYCPTFSAPQQHLRVWGTRWRGRREQLHQWTAVEQVELENS